MSSENRECLPSCPLPLRCPRLPLPSKTGLCRGRKRCKAPWQVACKHGDTDKGRTLKRPAGNEGRPEYRPRDGRGHHETGQGASGSRMLTSVDPGARDGRRAAETNMANNSGVHRTDPALVQFLLRALLGDCAVIGPTIATETFRIYPQHVSSTRNATGQGEGEKCCAGREMKESYRL